MHDHACRAPKTSSIHIDLQYTSSVSSTACDHIFFDMADPQLWEADEIRLFLDILSDYVLW